jgi:hypothetical protein
MIDLDRYDYVLTMLTGLIVVAILILYAALWAVALAFVAGWTAIFIRHIDEFRAK